MTVVHGEGMTAIVLPQVGGVTVTVIVTTVHHQVLGGRVMTVGEMIVGVTTDGVTIVVVMIGAVTTDGVMTVDATTVDATTVDAMTAGVTTVKDRWLGGDGIEMSGNVHQGILGVLTVIAVIGIVEAVKETASEEIVIVMIVIALGGGMSVQMIVTVTVIRGELEGMSQVVISGDENHALHALKVG